MLPLPLLVCTNQSIDEKIADQSKCGNMSERITLVTGWDTGRREQMSVYFNFDSIIIFSIVISHNPATITALLIFADMMLCFCVKRIVSMVALD